VPFFEETLAPARERFEAAMGAFAHEQQRMFAEAAHQSRSLDNASEWIVSAASVIAVLLAGTLAWFSIHRLSTQYASERAATEAARRATAAREEILAVVSHDLRNPLTAIAMGTSLLAETIESPTQRKHVAKIANAGSRMQSLIDQLLDVAQFESGKLALHRQHCDVPELFDSVTSLFDVRAADAGIEIHVEPYAAAVDADRERIIQVLSNLVANALKFTPRGGRVSLRAQHADAHVRFEVSDTGQGIAADQLPHLFDRYWQGHSRGRGSLGLGLYICKQLVAAHGGEIGVESVASSGSTFWFTLPSA
jgi:signal transduction histidine kinase